MGALINGKFKSYASMEVRVDGGPPIQAKGIKYGYKVSETIVKGRRGPRGRTRGQLEFEEGTLTLYEADYRDLATAGWLDRIHTITVTYAEGDDQPVDTDTLEGVRFLGDGNSGAEEGTDAIEHAIPFSMLNVKTNGVSPIGD